MERRGNAAMRADLKDAMRSFNAQDQRVWEQKYKFYSADHMKNVYRTFAKARHDPFNKDPSWGTGVFQKYGAALKKKGITMENLCGQADVSGDGTLNRAELKKVLLAGLPSLSDTEVASIFNVLDGDNSNEVSVAEFGDALKEACGSKAVTREATHRYRNPVHRVRRIAPAIIDGWEHLEGHPKHAKESDLCAEAMRGMVERLDKVSPRSSSLTATQKVSKYQNFNGGADSDRFRRRDWHTRDREASPSAIPDPGPDVKIGWHAVLAASGAQTAR